MWQSLVSVRYNADNILNMTPLGLPLNELSGKLGGDFGIGERQIQATQSASEHSGLNFGTLLASVLVLSSESTWRRRG